ncbi:alpha/beta fold hydrolase [Fulvivirgaceae bacterium BMA12]|uniref:Alpha/beta fold hydrolase n=1 Tax=Agaribacillus aureus TaxID=3051825 RepID=A0ABT8LDF5_9BACT|nr:alpha/beta fold hydrolase [Fulvivirgaceae bacterium BMA12]
MKNVKLILLALIIPLFTRAQDISGQWNGVLKVQGMELRLVFHITEEVSGYTATMDSPDQNATGIPVSSTSFENAALELKIDALNAGYTGVFEEGNGIKGTFRQAGQAFPLRLVRKKLEKKILRRPQEPKKPLPYYSEDVIFPGGDKGVELAGTLTLPEKEGQFPVAILISGSGPQNRNEEFMTHKPFLVLSDHLTRNGIAVLRYDDRGFASSTGNHGNATSEDFADDVRSAIAYLKTRKEINKKYIGLIGHSEGGLIAPMVAADTKVAFIVLLAGPGVSGDQILLKQIETIGRLRGADEKTLQEEINLTRGAFELIHQYREDESLEKRLTAYVSDAISKSNGVPEGVNKEDFISTQISRLTRPWMKYFLNYDPQVSLSQVKCPVLALNGEKDVQVTPGNLIVIESGVRKGGNSDVTIKEFSGMNHLFQTCKTGAMDEYATIEQTMDPVVLEEISNWIRKQVR